MRGTGTIGGVAAGRHGMEVELKGGDDVQMSLKAARVNAGLTQDDVAKKLRKNKQTVVNWELGRTIIDFANFSALCDLYGVPKEAISLPTTSSLS